MSYVLTWPSDRGPCCLEVSAATFHSLAASDPNAVLDGRALRFPRPAGRRATPVFFEPFSFDWMGGLCLFLASVCLVLGFYELKVWSGTPFEPPAIPSVVKARVLT